MRILILGAGGHGAVVAECAIAAGHEVIGFLDDDARLIGRSVLGLPVFGPIGDLVMLPAETQAIALGLGDNRLRQALLARAQARDLALPMLVHPHGWVSPSARCGAGTVVMAGGVIAARAALGTGCIINTGASVDHDCVLANAVHVAPGARLGGSVRVGDRALVGIGAAVRPGIVIGADCIVALGAAAAADIPDGMTVAGVPARPMAPTRVVRP